MHGRELAILDHSHVIPGRRILWDYCEGDVSGMDNRLVGHGWPERPLPATAQDFRLRSAHQSDPQPSLPNTGFRGICWWTRVKTRLRSLQVSVQVWTTQENSALRRNILLSSDPSIGWYGEPGPWGRRGGGYILLQFCYNKQNTQWNV